MSLLDKINTDLLSATKTRETLVRDTLRLLKTDLKNREISLGHSLNESEIITVISGQAKQRQESAAAFTAGQRPELAQKEEAELVILQRYLPEPLSESELASLIDQALNRTGATGIKEMGRVMAYLIPHIKGRADAAQISQAVKARLGG